LTFPQPKDEKHWKHLLPIPKSDIFLLPKL
jgi:hypothetical protein